ncbi:alpha/beta hydrolase-fold protein [Paenibacillus oryzisoli]|uniref:alpha/beta hydrolase n=1 Tax=Paenibacillus oryzisoli TaxID=1850517 RepID=UPI003D2DA866
MGAFEWSSHVLQSPALNARVVFRLVLPRDFSSTSLPDGERLPLLVLLHGVHGSETDWIDQGELIPTMNRLYDEGVIGLIAVLTPSDGLHGIGTGYLNWQSGEREHRYEDYLLEDLLSHVEARWPIGGSPGKRAVSGLSMGGYAAMRFALTKPQLWRSASSMSGFFMVEELGHLVGADTYARIVLPSVQQSDALSPLHLPLHAGARYPELLFDCGTSDAYAAQNRELSLKLAEGGIPHHFAEREGAHTWTYWRSSLAMHLDFHYKSSQGDEI